MSLPDVLMKLKMTATMLSSYLDKPYMLIIRVVDGDLSASGLSRGVTIIIK